MTVRPAMHTEVVTVQAGRAEQRVAAHGLPMFADDYLQTRVGRRGPVGCRRGQSRAW
jgi:hypothetical protein